MADILKNLNNIKKAVYGKDVRSSIVDSMEAINEEIGKVSDLAKNINNKQDNLDKKFDKQIENMTLKDPSSAEIVAARTSSNGITYDTIGIRMESIDNNVNYIKEKLVYPIKSGEIGVTNTEYVYGDCRRYGMFPDMECQLQSDNALKSCVALGIQLVLKPGYYKTQLNIGYDNVSIKFEDGAEVSGLIHVYVDDGKIINNVKFEGDVITYDRFGTRNVSGLYFDRIIVKANGKKATDYPNINGRGCHISPNTSNVYGHELIVKGLDENGANNQAAISIDGYIGNPSNINIDNLVVEDSDIHGVYLTGCGHNIRNIIVNNFGKGQYKEKIGMEDSNGLSQSQELKGVWINRCWNTNIENINVSCNNVSDNAKYCVVLDETGKNQLIGTVNIGNINVTNTKGVNCLMINDKNYVSSNANYNINNVFIDNKSNVTDYSLMTIADFSRVNIENIVIKNILECNAFQALSRYECNIRNMNIDDCKMQAIYLDGLCNIDNLYVNRIGDLDNKYLMEMTEKSSYTRLGKINLDCKVKLNAKAFQSVASYFVIDYLRTGLHICDYGTVHLKECMYSKINYLNLVGMNTEKTGVAIIIENLTEFSFSNLNCLYFSKGIVMSGTMTRCSFQNSISSGNAISNTNIPDGIVEKFNCTGITL